MVDATGAIGPGDRMVLAHAASRVRLEARSAALAAELDVARRPWRRRPCWWW